MSDVIIIGGGIAGCHAAYALCARGLSVTVIEAGPGLAGGASGNDAAIVMPRLHLGDDPIASFNRAAYTFAHGLYAHLNRGGEALFEQCGVVQLARDGQEAERFRVLGAQAFTQARGGGWLDRQTAGEIAGMALAEAVSGALWHADAGWVRPRLLCAALSRKATLRAGTGAFAIAREPDGWRVMGSHGDVLGTTPQLVITNGLDSRLFDPLGWQPLRPKRGQVTMLNAAQVAPRTVLTFGHYLTPAVSRADGADGAADARLITGATFDPWEDAVPARLPETTTESNAANLAALRNWLPDFEAAAAVTGARASLRATTPDHLPLAGPAVDRGGNPLPGLYLMTGMGSTGFVTAALCAEIVACHMLAEPPPVPAALTDAIAPRRFIDRALKRGETL